MKTSIFLFVATIALFFPGNSLCQNPEPRERGMVERRPPKENPKIKEEESERKVAVAEIMASASSISNMQTAGLMSRRMKYLNPKLDSAQLDLDEPVVAVALSEIKEQFAREKLESTDAEDAIYAAWLIFRIDAKSLTLTVEVLVDRVDSMGKLIVGSDPTDAQVEIKADDHLLSTDRTEAKKWLSARTYRVRLSKPGYAPVEEDVEVKSRQKTEFKRTLTAQQ